MQTTTTNIWKIQFMNFIITTHFLPDQFENV